MSAGRQSTLSVTDLFLVAFVCMKVAGAIEWSWWLVLIPFYLDLVVAIVKEVRDS